jgi:hypothetical protein
MADMRAIEEQSYRQQMHGGQFYGAGMVGAGATPSMGLSQFRGGASHKCPECLRKRCVCEESSSDEDMEGGGWFSGLLGAVGDVASAATRAVRGVRNAVPPPAVSSSLVRYNPVQAAFTANSGFRNYVLQNAFSRPSTALATRATGELKPYSAAEAAARVRAAQAAGETAETVAAKLARMGITPTRVAAALAIGIPAITLAAYFGEQDAAADDSGFYYPQEIIVDRPPNVISDPPQPPGVTVDVPIDIPAGPRGSRGRRATGEGVATGNLADEYFTAQRRGAGQPRRSNPTRSVNPREPDYTQLHIDRIMRGRGKPRRSNARAALVGKIMREKGLSLPAASRYVKENGLY